MVTDPYTVLAVGFVIEEILPQTTKSDRIKSLKYTT